MAPPPSIPKFFSPNDEALKLYTPKMLRSQYLLWSDPVKLKKTELQKLKKLGITVDQDIELPVALYRSKNDHPTQIKESILPRFFSDFNTKEIAPSELTKKWIKESGCCYRWLICKYQGQKVPTKPPPKGKVFTMKPKYVTLRQFRTFDFDFCDKLLEAPDGPGLFKVEDDDQVTKENKIRISSIEKKKKPSRNNGNNIGLDFETSSLSPSPLSPIDQMPHLSLEKEQAFEEEKKNRKQKRDLRLEEESPPSPKRKIPIKIFKTDPAAIIPDVATLGSAGADLFSVEDKSIVRGQNALLSTGLIMEIPKSFFIKIHSRSGLASKDKITTEAGIIDSDYRGVVFVLLRNNSGKDFYVKKGDKIAQMILAKSYEPKFIDVEKDKITKTERKGGFGSTGK